MVPTNSVTDDHQCCQKVGDLDRLMVAIKEKFVVFTVFFYCLCLVGPLKKCRTSLRFQFLLLEDQQK